jgi:guanylate cyclase
MKLFSLDIPTSLARLASNPGDDQDTVLKKSALVITSLMVVVAATIWGIIYVLYDEPKAGAIPLGYAILSLLSLIWLTRKNFRFYLISQLTLIISLPFLLMTALGGYVPSSAVGIWALTGALGALTFTSRPQAVRLMGIYLALLIIAGLIEPYTRLKNNLPPSLITLFFVLNLGTVSSIVFVLMAYFVHEKDRFLHLLNLEQQRSESLLLNILPREIAAILKKEQRVIADQYDSASILFADMAGFTKLSAKLPPQEMVVLLNEIFGAFDTLVEKHDLEKIRTIGDNYMVAAGLPRTRTDHASALVDLAVEMQAFLHEQQEQKSSYPAFRIGINSGPVIAGVIGHKKFQYDVWGDAVNVASRMESHGLPGEIQITRSTYDLVQTHFQCIPRGTISVKGKGEMATWQIARPSPDTVEHG